jgi:hypothetical protein
MAVLQRSLGQFGEDAVGGMSLEPFGAGAARPHADGLQRYA